MYLDGGKILGEDRANYELRYLYDVSGLKIIRLHKNNTYYNYECIKDSQGSIIAIINLRDNVLAAQYEYDALGKCTVLVNDDEMAAMNPFRWKGFFYDSETGFYYANGSYYDPETGMYVDAAPVSTVIDNVDSPRHIDRNGTLCYNHLAIAGSPYTVFPVTDMQADPNYTPGQTWWDKLWGTIGSWWRNIPKWQKVLVGAIFIAVSIGIAVATCGASVGPEAQLLGGAASAAALTSAAKVALIEVSIGIGFAVAGWAINAADTGDWSVGALEEAVADSIFFTGLYLFISTSISAIKYMYRADPYPTPEIINNNPLDDLTYTNKVQSQMYWNDNHGFPLIVDNFGSNGTISIITGGDKNKYIRVIIQGSYKNADGFFEYIYDFNKICNHRGFIKFK